MLPNSIEPLKHKMPTVMRSSGNRLALATLGFSFVFTLMTVGVRTWSTWQENLDSMMAELTLIEQVYQSTLTKAIWESDIESLQKHLVGAGRVPNIGKIVVKANSTGFPALQFARPGWANSTIAPSRHLILRHAPYPGAPEETVGELRLFGDERLLWSRLRQGVRDILLTQVIQFLLLAGLLILMFNRLLTVHIKRIATHLADLRPDNLSHALTLERKLARPDELTLLVSGVNQLQGNLHDYLQQKLRYEHELSENRDQLQERSDALTVANNALADSADTLRQLGEIGKDLTTSLDQDAICLLLHRHLERMLPLDTFGVGKVDHEALEILHYFEDGVLAAPITISLQHPTSVMARACRAGNGLLILDEAELANAPIQQDIVQTQPMRSALIRSLVANGKLLGVLIVQSRLSNAYQTSEIEVFSTVASYATIALSNAIVYKAADKAWQQAANALEDLRQAQAQLIQSEKMAALGQLIAGVAHEINTPIGALKSSGSNIADSLNHTMTNLPRIFRDLDLDGQELFVQLISHVSEANELLSTREERAIVRDTTLQLEVEQVPDAHRLASILVQLRAYRKLKNYLPLLRHPLCEFILDTAYGVATIVSNTNNINNAVDRVAKIVFALKLFSRMDQEGATIESDLRSGLETVITIYQNQIRQHTELVRQYEDIAPIRCWPDELNQVWTNLIHNALQAMQNKGTLTVSIRRVGNEAVVGVSDTGCGIPENIRARIFEPFFTTKPIGEGSGLGLDITRKIIEKHKGRIEVFSEIGHGTTFMVHLPYES